MAREMLKSVVIDPAAATSDANAHAAAKARECLDQLQEASWEDVDSPMIVFATVTQPYPWSQIVRLSVFVIEKERVCDVALIDRNDRVLGRVGVETPDWEVPTRNIGVLLSTRPCEDPFERVLSRECERQAGVRLPLLRLDEKMLATELYVRVSDGTHTSQLEPVFVEQVYPLTEWARGAIRVFIRREAPSSRRAAPGQAVIPTKSEDLDLGPLFDPFGKTFPAADESRFEIADAMLAVVNKMQSDNFDRPVAPVVIVQESGSSSLVHWVWLESGFGVRGFWAEMNTGAACEHPSVIDWDGADESIGSERWVLRGQLLRRKTVVVTRHPAATPIQDQPTFWEREPVVCKEWGFLSEKRTGAGGGS
jgi:hypothetical protein